MHLSVLLIAIGSNLNKTLPQHIRVNSERERNFDSHVVSEIVPPPSATALMRSY